MTDQRSTEDWIAASLEAMDRYQASRESAPSDPSPRPGDLYVLPATRDYDVEWLVVAREPAPDPPPANDSEPSTRVLIMPADAHVLAGSADVEVTSADGGPLVVHCAYGIWIDPALLTPDFRVSRIEPTNLTRVRRRWLELGDGRESDDPVALEVDESTEYQEWIEEVIAPAQRALSRASASSSPPSTPSTPVVPATPAGPTEAATDDEGPFKQRSSHPPFFKIAASILVALASIQLWRLHDRVQDLEVAYRGAEEHYGAKVSELEGERDRLSSERDRLRARQQELEAAGEAYREEAGQLREQVEELDRRLGEAEGLENVINPALVIFASPRDHSRGVKEVELHSDQRYIVFILFDPPKASEYRLEVRTKGSSRVVWQVDRLKTEKQEIRVGIPARSFTPGAYRLDLLAVNGSDVEQVAGYELIVKIGSISD